MANTKEIRDKIKSTTNTQKITRAMEMVAASKMRKTQQKMQACRPYSNKIMKVIRHLALGHSEYRHPYLEKRKIQKVAYLIISTDRGLCGGLNSNLFKKALEEIQKKQETCEVELYLIGKKAQSFFQRFGLDIQGVKTDIGDRPELTDILGVTKLMLEKFDSGRIDSIKVLYNQFINTMVQKPVITQLIPLVPDSDLIPKSHWDYIYEPDAKDILEQLLTRYVESTIYQSVVENIACEQSARMMAMKSATDNASTVIDSYTLKYNKARQASITQEISEIIGGAAAV